MPNRSFAFGLFLSSYAPALLILAVRAYDHSWLLFGLATGVALVSGLGLFLFLWLARQGGPFLATVDAVESNDAELAAYVATYLLPFVVVFGASAQDALALGLFLAFIGILWVNSGLLYLNPLLALAGYHIYVADISPVGGGASTKLERAFLVSRQAALRPGDEIRPDRISSNTFIDLTSPSHGSH